MGEKVYFKCKVCGINCTYVAKDKLCYKHTKDSERIKLFEQYEKERRWKKGSGKVAIMPKLTEGTKESLIKIKQKETSKFMGASLSGGYKGVKHHYIGKRNKRIK